MALLPYVFFSADPAARTNGINAHLFGHMAAISTTISMPPYFNILYLELKAFWVILLNM